MSEKKRGEHRVAANRNSKSAAIRHFGKIADFPVRLRDDSIKTKQKFN